MKIERLSSWRCPDIVFGLASEPDSTKLFLGSSDFGVYEFETSVEKPERVPFAGEKHESYVTSLVLADNLLISSSYDGTLIWWDVTEHKSIRRIAAHDRWVRKLALTPDKKRVVSVADDMQCKVWDATTGEAIAQFTDHTEQTPHHYPSMLYAVAVSPDGRWIATGDRTGHTAIWDANSFEKVGEVESPVLYTWDPRARRHSIGGIRSLGFSHDGKHIAVGGIGKIGNIDHLGGPSRLEVFAWESGEKLHELEDDQRKGLIEQIRWHPSGDRVLCAGGDHKGFVNVWDLTSGKLATQEGGDGHIHALVTNTDHSKFYTTGHEHVEHWQIAEV